jgi:hypothetical protein
MILRSKADFWMICGKLGMEPNIALILNWSQAPIGMYQSKLGVFLCLPNMASEMSYGKNISKFKLKVLALQGAGRG